MKSSYFLTGTDTEIGKTFITCALLQHGQILGLKVAGLKPIAAGTDVFGKNEDVEQIRAASNVHLPDAILNPYCFSAAVAPHIAAADASIGIDFTKIKSACNTARRQTDLLIVEGVGGFRVPLGTDQDSADLAIELGLPIILVVGMRLGCINHALLTIEAITHRPLKIAGWVANQIDPTMARFDENQAILQGLIKAPLLGVMPHLSPDDKRAAANFLQLPGDLGL